MNISPEMFRGNNMLVELPCTTSEIIVWPLKEKPQGAILHQAIELTNFAQLSRFVEYCWTLLLLTAL